MSKIRERSLLARARRKKRVRKRVLGTSERPRLTVYRSSKHIYAQVIDDVEGRTLACASSLLPDAREDASESTKKDLSRKVGELLASRCLEVGVKNVVFDRNGYRYQSGRIRNLAEGAREAGLKF